MFHSRATNLVPGDTNGVVDVFVRDRVLGVTTRASVGPSGNQGNALGSESPTISDDGRYVAFESSSTNLVIGDTNGFLDVFVRDLVAGTTERVSVGTGGAQTNYHSDEAAISADGSVVAFVSLAWNLVLGDGTSSRTCSTTGSRGRRNA